MVGQDLNKPFLRFRLDKLRLQMPRIKIRDEGKGDREYQESEEEEGREVIFFSETTKRRFVCLNDTSFIVLEVSLLAPACRQ